MNEKEIKLLQGYVKKRYDEVGMDYMTFSEDVDTLLSYQENKRIIDEKLQTLLPQNLKNLKNDIMESVNAIKEAEKLEIKKIEEQAKLQFEEQLEKIAKTPNSVLLNELYYVPRQYIKMVLEKRSKGLLLYGEAGLGKTFNVKKELIEHNLKEGVDFTFICGHITTMSFYKKLYYNRDKIVILDDINILESKINLNMLKATLQDGMVEYTSSALKDVPNQFIFTGQIIILLNDKPKNNEHLKAVESRILTYHLEMDYKRKMSILYDIAKVEYKGISLEQRQKLVEWIKNNTSEATKNLSIRLLFMVFEFYKFDPEKWETLGKSYIQNDEYATLIIQGISGKDWEEKTGLSARTMRRYKKEMGK